MHGRPGTVKILGDRGLAVHRHARSEQVAQGIVRPRFSPLVVEARPSRGYEVAAALDKPPNVRCTDGPTKRPSRSGREPPGRRRRASI